MSWQALPVAKVELLSGETSEAVVSRQSLSVPVVLRQQLSAAVIELLSGEPLLSVTV